MPLSGKEKAKLEAQLKEISASLKADDDAKLIESMAPITQGELDDYMRKFAAHTLQPYYESWEFSSEDLYGIQRMAIKAGLRPKNYWKENEGLRELVIAADKAIANKS